MAIAGWGRDCCSTIGPTQVLYLNGSTPMMRTSRKGSLDNWHCSWCDDLMQPQSVSLPCGLAFAISAMHCSAQLCLLFSTLLSSALLSSVGSVLLCSASSAGYAQLSYAQLGFAQLCWVCSAQLSSPGSTSFALLISTGSALLCSARRHHLSHGSPPLAVHSPRRGRPAHSRRLLACIVTHLYSRHPFVNRSIAAHLPRICLQPTSTLGAGPLALR